MSNALSKYVEAATGLTQLTKAKAEQIVKQVLKQGSGVTGSASGLVEDLLDRSRRNREAITSLVKSETQRAVKAMGFATQADVERLERQVAEVRRSSAAKKATKKSPAKKAAKKTAKKSTG